MGYLFGLFVAVSLIEIALFMVIGSYIGLWWTLALVLATAAIGAYLVAGQGAAVARRAAAVVRAGQMPAAELAHGAMVLVGGALLLTPGFITDLVGLALMAPSVRERIRRFWVGRLRNRPGIIDL